MDLPLYRRVADRLADAIRAGTYRHGDRLPSVRGLARDWDVAINTVIEAYRSLELDGVVAARPQAGFFVTAGNAVDEPAPSQPPGEPTTVTTGDLALRVLTDGRKPGILPLGAALPDPRNLPLAELSRTMRRLLGEDEVGAHGYAMPPGDAGFRSAVAKHWLATGCKLRPDEVVATSGGLEALGLALRATCAPGAVVAVESPTYYGILQVLDGLGLRALEVPCSAATGMDLGAMRFLLGEHAVGAVLVIPNFTNPAGGRMPEAAKRELALLCAERRIPLIEDDIYGDLAHDGSRPGICKTHAPDDVLLCSSFSKTIAPGIRLGFCAGGRWSPQVLRLKASTSIAAPTLAQRAVGHLLASGAFDRHMRRVRPLYGRSTQAMAQAVASAFPMGTRVSRPTGGYVLWIEMPPAVDGVRLYELALRAGIGIAPGPLFSPRGRFANCLRLTAASWDPPRQEAIATLGKLATKLAK